MRAELGGRVGRAPRLDVVVEGRGVEQAERLGERAAADPREQDDLREPVARDLAAVLARELEIGVREDVRQAVGGLAHGLRGGERAGRERARGRGGGRRRGTGSIGSIASPLLPRRNGPRTSGESPPRSLRCMLRAPCPPKRPLPTDSLRRILVASSLGTLFEWYDFYLYGTLAVFFGELFFPPGNERAALLASLATFGAGLRRAPARRARVRAHRRPHRPQVHLPRHASLTMGLVDRAHRPPADLRDARPRRAGPARDAAARCRASRSAASTAAPRPTSPSTCPTRGAATTRASSRPRRRSASSSRSA